MMDLVITALIKTLKFQFRRRILVGYNDRKSRFFSMWGEDDGFHEISHLPT